MCVCRVLTSTIGTWRKLEGNGSLGEAWTWSPGESEGLMNLQELPLEGPLCHRDSPAPRSPPGLMTMPQVLTTSKHTSAWLAEFWPVLALCWWVNQLAPCLRPGCRHQGYWEQACLLLLEWREGLPRAGPPWAESMPSLPAQCLPPCLLCLGG